MEFNVFVDILESMGFKAISYSGRRMYGASCVGISTDEGEREFFASLIECVLDAADEDEVYEKMSEVAEIVRGCQIDSLGLGKVLYWPRIKWEEGS